MLLTEEDLRDYKFRRSIGGSISSAIWYSIIDPVWDSIYAPIMDSIHFSVKRSMYRRLEDVTN